MLGAMIIKSIAPSSFDAVNRRDINALLKNWHCDAVFIFPGQTPISGEHKGLEAIRKWWDVFLQQFERIKFTCDGVYVKNIFAIGATNEVVTRWHVLLIDREGNEFRNQGVSVVQIKSGKIVRFQDFLFDHETLHKAWSKNK